jgi:hypothetical protein
MQWWNNFVDWLTSEDGWRILSTVVFPFLAIIVAGLIAAMIGRGATRRLIVHHDREQRVSTVAALIGAARRASKYNTLSAPEQEHADHLAHDADISTRLLPLPGASMTADWAAHEIAEMKKNSVSFSFQAEQSLMDFRDRLVEWQSRPSRAKKLFKADLDLWAYESAQEDKGMVEKQQEWAKQQVATESEPNSTGSETKSISWDAPAIPTRRESTPVVPEPAQVTASATPSTTPAHSPAERADYGFTGTAAGPVAVAPSPGGQVATASTGEHAEIPSPVSAQAVRQRDLPDNYEEDELR